jgi:hypothetical protein
MPSLFYSWQSDSPSQGSREVLRGALELATLRMATGMDEANRLIVDEDTRGLPGSPAIATSILDKIGSCEVFVADVTLCYTADSRAGRRAPNPNVLIELGYAFHAVGTGRVLMVMDASFGSPESLPFDLRSNRVLVYSCPADLADGSGLRENLASKLELSLRTILEKAGIPRPTPPPLSVALTHRERVIQSRYHEYRLYVNVSNNTQDIIRNWGIELRMPRPILKPDNKHSVLELSSDEKFAVMRRGQEFGSGPIYPGEDRSVLIVDYVMNDDLWENRAAFFDLEIVAKVFVNDKFVSEARRRMRDMQVY